VDILSTYLPRGHITYDSHREEWIWEGGRFAYVSPMSLLRTGIMTLGEPLAERFALGRHRVRFVRHDRVSMNVLVVKDTWAAPLWIALDKLARTYDTLAIMMIRVLEIWDLASKPEGTVYTWRNVHVIDRVANKVESLLAGLGLMTIKP
jgi:hypothetical protein